MKNCEEIAALLDAWIDGALSEPEMAEVRSHLAVCGDCRAYVDAALAIRAAFPLVEETEVPAGFADGVMAAIRLESRKHKKTPWGKFLLPLAACLALIVAVEKLPMAGAPAPEAAPFLEQRLLGTTGVPEQDAAVAEAEVTPDAGAAPPVAPPPAGNAVPEANVAPKGEAAPRMSSPPAAPAGDVPGEEPAGAGVGIMATRTPAPVLTLTAAQAGTLLDAFTGCAYESGTVSGTLYTLTPDEYATLLAALPDSILQPPAPDAEQIQVLVTL